MTERSMTPSRGCALVVALMLAFGGVAHAERGGRAATLRQRGLEHFVNREYQLAADDLMEAYRLDRRQATLLGWAEAVRLTGDCELATRIYQLLLRKASALKITRQAELGVAACEAEAPATSTRLTSGSAEPEVEIEEPTAVDLVEPEGPSATPPTPAAPAAPPSDNPHLTSYLVIGGGVVAVLTGLVTYANASDTAAPGANHAVVTTTRSDADWQRVIGASIAVVGGAATLVGVVIYRGENRHRDARVVLSPYGSATSAGLAVGGGF